MDTFPLVIEGHSHRVILHSPGFADEGWMDSYVIRVEGDGITAETTVWSVYSGEDLVTFFRDLEKNWRGWEGEKRWRSSELDLTISATTTMQGRVSLTFSIEKRAFDERWQGQVTVCTYAGELRTLLTRLEAFFGHEP